MKVLIFSDSHGNVANMEEAVRLESPDRIFHLGDLVRDAEALAEKFPNIPLTYVPGNCDGQRPDLPEERLFTLDGVKILMTHGHIYHVKMSMALAVRSAREEGARLLCFGHTHEPFCKFENGLWILNPGSVGSFREASYGVAVLEDSGAVCYLSHV
ncbi:metallophosphoesterase family protein [Pseudoflavonifractor phocaeensis]|uniref:metallophosphoesterase family protein n=1 Tax=Pseudoflavonifractor phocaeensis TaxID=1870988 RepID=UPI00195E0A46|nr:metallophosphoesterase [Pseudoflavonifractor phocaeensis]MBM6925983.1 metallophosphoesterase [Pseudoflavonifractor phocaeensis]